MTWLSVRRVRSPVLTAVSGSRGPVVEASGKPQAPGVAQGPDGFAGAAAVVDGPAEGLGVVGLGREVPDALASPPASGGVVVTDGDGESTAPTCPGAHVSASSGQTE